MWLFYVLTIKTKYNITGNSQIYIKIAREDSVMSLLICYIDINFDVLHAASNDTYVVGNDVSLVIIGPIASFSNFNLTTSSGKHLKHMSRSYCFIIV